MKFLKILALIIMTSPAFAATHISENELIQVTQVSESQIELTIKSIYFCNDPIVSLDYDFSGKAIWGPHSYQLQVVPQNKMKCVEAQEITVALEIPKATFAGQVLVIQSQNSALSLVIQ